MSFCTSSWKVYQLTFIKRKLIWRNLFFHFPKLTGAIIKWHMTIPVRLNTSNFWKSTYYGLTRPLIEEVYDKCFKIFTCRSTARKEWSACSVLYWILYCSSALQMKIISIISSWKFWNYKFRIGCLIVLKPPLEYFRKGNSFNWLITTVSQENATELCDKMKNT